MPPAKAKNPKKSHMSLGNNDFAATLQKGADSKFNCSVPHHMIFEVCDCCNGLHVQKDFGVNKRNHHININLNLRQAKEIMEKFENNQTYFRFSGRLISWESYKRSQVLAIQIFVKNSHFTSNARIEKIL